MNNLFIPPAHFIDRLKTEEVHIISLTAKLGQIYFQMQKNYYIQLSIKYSFKKQSDLVNLGMYLTLHIYDISYSIIIKITP